MGEIGKITKAKTRTLISKKWPLFPICIPSYKRWDRKDNKTLTKIIESCGPMVQARTYVFVRKEQEAAYRENYKSVKIVTLPEVKGLAGTRQYIQDYVTETLKLPYFIDMDDFDDGDDYDYDDGEEEEDDDEVPEDFDGASWVIALRFSDPEEARVWCEENGFKNAVKSGASTTVIRMKE